MPTAARGQGAVCLTQLRHPDGEVTGLASGGHCRGASPAGSSARWPSCAHVVRGNEIAFVALAILAGAVSGAAVAVVSHAAQLLHELAFAIAPGERLSASGGLPAWRVLAVPALGGLLLGGLGLLLRRLPVRDAIDPIEANALYGGRMSLTDSARGRAADDDLQRRRRLGRARGRLHPDRLGPRLRPRPARSACAATTCACWSAAARPAPSAAAFNAPLTGAFYAFELVIGNYTRGHLRAGRRSAPSPAPPCARLLGGPQHAGRDPAAMPPWPGTSYLLLLGLAVICRPGRHRC